MNTSKHTHCMSLRLEPQLDEIITAAAFDRRMTKSDFIRLAIRQCIKKQTSAITARERTCR